MERMVHVCILDCLGCKSVLKSKANQSNMTLLFPFLTKRFYYYFEWKKHLNENEHNIGALMDSNRNPHKNGNTYKNTNELQQKKRKKKEKNENKGPFWNGSAITKKQRCWRFLFNTEMGVFRISFGISVYSKRKMKEKNGTTLVAQKLENPKVQSLKNFNNIFTSSKFAGCTFSNITQSLKQRSCLHSSI